MLTFAKPPHKSVLVEVVFVRIVTRRNLSLLDSRSDFFCVWFHEFVIRIVIIINYFFCIWNVTTLGEEMLLNPSNCTPIPTCSSIPIIFEYLPFVRPTHETTFLNIFSISISVFPFAWYDFLFLTRRTTHTPSWWYQIETSSVLEMRLADSRWSCITSLFIRFKIILVFNNQF